MHVVSCWIEQDIWEEAENYASHLINRLPAVEIGGKTPMEVWFNKPATDYDLLHVFGCLSYFYLIESKLDLRAKKAIFLGFSFGPKAYRL